MTKTDFKNLRYLTMKFYLKYDIKFFIYWGLWGVAPWQSAYLGPVFNPQHPLPQFIYKFSVFLFIFLYILCLQCQKTKYLFQNQPSCYC
jgi:O-antigen/teichoic acid export membrane protein